MKYLPKKQVIELISRGAEIWTQKNIAPWSLYPRYYLELSGKRLGWVHPVTGSKIVKIDKEK